MRFMMFMKHPEDHGDEEAPPALYEAMGFVELHRRRWPGFEGESEMRPLEEEAQ